MAGQDLQKAGVEIGLQGVVVGQVALLLEGLDRGIGVPVAALDFVAPDVEIGVGEERGHLAEELVEERVDALVGGIEGRFGDAEPALDGVGAGRAGELGVGDEPARRMPGDVELRHDPDAAVGGIFDDVTDLGLRVIHAVRAELVEAGEDFGLHAEPLVLGEMPMEDVHLQGGHAVQVPLDDLDGMEMTPGIDEQAPPGETGPVDDLDAGDVIPRLVRAEQLKEGFEAAEDADVGRRRQDDLSGVDDQRVGFVLERLELSRPGEFVLNGAGGGRSLRGQEVLLEEDPRPGGQAGHEPGGGPKGPVPGSRLSADRQAIIHPEPPIAEVHALGHRHEVERGLLRSGLRGPGRSDGQEGQHRHA